MNLEVAITEIRKLVRELEQLPMDPNGAGLHLWRERAMAVLRVASPQHNDDAMRILTTRFSPSQRTSAEYRERYFEEGRARGQSILEGVAYQLELQQALGTVDHGSIDPELLEHVFGDIEAERWAQVASQSAIFFESKLREWTGLSESVYGIEVANRVLKPEGGSFPLGKNPGEQQGWLALGRGIFGALSNVDRHRIQDREDLQRYAQGVLGAVSLVLTQLRFEHGNRFKS